MNKQVELIKQTIRTTSKPEFKVTATYPNENTGRYYTFVVPEKRFRFATRLVRVETDKYIEYKIYSIPMFNLNRNKKHACNEFRLEKINFRDASSRVVLRASKLNETQEERDRRINLIVNKYKNLTDKERLRIISRDE